MWFGLGYDTCGPVYVYLAWVHVCIHVCIHLFMYIHTLRVAFHTSFCFFLAQHISICTHTIHTHTHTHNLMIMTNTAHAGIPKVSAWSHVLSIYIHTLWIFGPETHANTHTYTHSTHTHTHTHTHKHSGLPVSRFWVQSTCTKYLYVFQTYIHTYIYRHSVLLAL